MSKLGNWLNQREINKAKYDQMIFGVSYLYYYNRYPWNPLYYILGVVKVKRIKPDAIIIRTRKNGL